MGYPETVSTKRDPRIAAVSDGARADSRRYVSRPPRLAPDVSDFPHVVSERGTAVQYCIRNDLI